MSFERLVMGSFVRRGDRKYPVCYTFLGLLFCLAGRDLSKAKRRDLSESGQKALFPTLICPGNPLLP